MPERTHEGSPRGKILFAPGNPDDRESLLGELEQARRTPPARIEADPETVERGLAKLVLSLVELLRQVLERQAIRRVEAGVLSDEEIERLGRTLSKLEERMDDLKKTFGLEDEDLRLGLGSAVDLDELLDPE